MKIIELYPHGPWTKRYDNAYMIAIPAEFVIAVSQTNKGSKESPREYTTLTICGPVGLPYKLELQDYKLKEIYDLLGWSIKD